MFVLSKLFKAALIAYVSSNAPRQLHLYHFGERRNLTTTNYPNSILSVLMNRSVCFICVLMLQYIRIVTIMVMVIAIFNCYSY